MAATDLTIQLNGEVSLKAYASATESFQKIIAELSQEAGGGVTWVVSGQECGGTALTATGEAPEEGRVAHVSKGYVEMAQHLGRGELIANPRLRTEAESLTRLLKDGVTTIRFSTPDAEVEITETPTTIDVVPYVESYDMLKGRVRMITDQGGLRCTLYVEPYGTGVTCYLRPGLEETIRELWKREAVVEGLVRRDKHTGRPSLVKDIISIERAADTPPNRYLPGDARGMFPWRPGDPLPEELVRKMRDAG